MERSAGSHAWPHITYLARSVCSLHALSSDSGARSAGRVSSRLSWRCHRAAHLCRNPAVCSSSATFCLRAPAKSTGVAPSAGSSSAVSFRRFGALLLPVAPLAELLLRFFPDTVGTVAVDGGGGVLTVTAASSAPLIVTWSLLFVLLIDGDFFLVVATAAGALSIASFGGRALRALGVVAAVVGVDVDRVNGVEGDKLGGGRWFSVKARGGLVTFRFSGESFTSGTSTSDGSSLALGSGVVSEKRFVLPSQRRGFSRLFFFRADTYTLSR